MNDNFKGYIEWPHTDKGLIANLIVRDGEITASLYLPDLNDIEKLCREFNLSYSFVVDIITHTDPANHTILIDAPTFREHHNKGR